MKLASISSILLGGVVGLFATFSLVIDLTNPTIEKIGIELIFMIVGYLTCWQGLTNHMYEQMISKKMAAEWEYQMAPFMKLLQDTAGKVNALEVNALETNAKVSHTLDQINNQNLQNIDIIPGASFKFIVKVMMLLTFTFSALVYVSEYPLGIVHYFILVLYVLWWVLITSEYKMWKNSSAWIVGITPVLIIPTVGILLDAIIGLNNMIGILFFFMFLYAYSYYTWASHITTGFQLINLKPIKELIRRQ